MNLVSEEMCLNVFNMSVGLITDTTETESSVGLTPVISF